MFDTFQVVFARDRAVALIDEHGSDLHNNVLIHAEAGGKLILVLVSQMSLRGYFGQPPDDIEPAPAKPTIAEWNQVVDHNIDAFKRIAFSMFKSGRTVTLTNAFRRTFTGLFITEREMRESDEVLIAL